MFQVFMAIEYMHKVGYLHKDLKLDNLLITKNVIKVADFGMAREIMPNKPYTSNATTLWYQASRVLNEPYTSYVTTLWYRAPEVLLQSSSYGAYYGTPIDVWAMETIMVELFILCPLFHGIDKVDQIYQICTMLGPPTKQTLPNGVKMAAFLNFKFPEIAPTPLAEILNCSPEALNMISTLCTWDPEKRPTMSQALQHPFFKQRQRQRTPWPISEQGCQYNL